MEDVNQIDHHNTFQHMCPVSLSAHMLMMCLVPMWHMEAVRHIADDIIDQARSMEELTRQLNVQLSVSTRMQELQLGQNQYIMTVFI